MNTYNMYDSLTNVITSNDVIKKEFDKKLLQENMELKKEVETLKIKCATSEIRKALEDELDIKNYIRGYIEYSNENPEEKISFIEYAASGRFYYSLETIDYINLCKQYGFELVDKVIEDMVDEKRKEMESEE